MADTPSDEVVLAFLQMSKIIILQQASSLVEPVLNRHNCFQCSDDPVLNQIIKDFLVHNLLQKMENWTKACPKSPDAALAACEAVLACGSSLANAGWDSGSPHHLNESSSSAA